jgi:hypothetical protein
MTSFEETRHLAEALHASRVFRTPSWEVALAIILYGREIGLGPVSALLNVSIVQGKPTLGASGVGALVKRSQRYDYRVTEHDDRHAVVEFSERREGQWAVIGTSTFTLDDARRAGLGGSPTWKNYPRNLLLARALTNGVRWYCPSVTLGSIYDPEELVGTATADTDDLPMPDPPMAPANGAAGPTITLAGLTEAYGADAVFEASGGALPATDEQLRAVAERLAAIVPTVGAGDPEVVGVGDA